MCARLEKQGRFQFPYSLRHLFRVKDVALHVKKKSMNNPALVQPTFSAIKTLNRVITGLAVKKVENNADFRMVQSPIFDDRANTLWEKVKDNYNYVIVSLNPNRCCTHSIRVTYNK